jgi:hypothetical protein
MLIGAALAKKQGDRCDPRFGLIVHFSMFAILIAKVILCMKEKGREAKGWD